jgi:hypothetical protein
LEPTPLPKARPTDEDGNFPGLRDQVKATFGVIAATTRPLFRTDAVELFPLFLDHLPPRFRQHYTCSCCRGFLRRYGGLAVVGDDGRLTSALWPAPEDVPETFARAVEALRSRVEAARIAGVFLTANDTLGTPVTGEWTHLSVVVPAERRHRSLVQSAAQVAAARHQELAALRRGLDEFPQPVLMKALNLLLSGGLYRSEKAEGVIHWLLGLHETRACARDERSLENLLWVAAATAPAGFCHVRSGVVGTLLEDIAADLPEEDVQRKWATKLAPSQYMRAQAPPAAGNIAQAEKIIEKLKAAGALQRRYARLDELPTFLWRPASPPGTAPEAPAASAVFGHIAPKTKAPAPEPRKVTPQKIMHWEEFWNTVLSEAQRIEVQIPQNSDRFVALMTAAQPGAPPILQWDSEEARNPFSWYYAAGIDAEIRRRVLEAGGTYEGVDLRASLLWNNRNDLDLHALTPDKEHIYFGNKKGTCGGWLDVDMNIRGETETPVENIRWLKGAAKAGTYVFYVQNYRFHEHLQAPTPFRIELEVNGEIFHHDGVISPARQTGADSDVIVTEFLFTPGQKLGAPPRGMRHAEEKGAWNVAPNQWVPVTGIVPSPNLWGDRPLRQHGRHLFFLLHGCRDTRRGVGRGFFVETLKGEFHPIRSTLEAYTATATLEGSEEATACGLGMSDQAPWDLLLRVTTASGTTLYQIDRWE